MAWVCVSKHEEELVFNFKPHRAGYYKESWEGDMEGSWQDEPVELPRGSIKKLIGRELSFSDEPVELKEE